jgi:serine O-acetyltransferase
MRFLGTALIHYGWHAAFFFRLSQWTHWLYLYPVSFLFQRLILHLYGIDIPPSTEIGSGLWMPHARNIVIHKNSWVGKNVTILHNVTLGGRGSGEEKYPVVEDGAALYVGCSVLGPVIVGNQARIGAHSLVIENVPEKTIVAGVPARVIKKIV